MTPAPYAVHYADASVSKAALKLSEDIFNRIDAAIQELRVEPRGLKTKQLHGFRPPLYELRIHPYRVLYDIDDDMRTIVILAIIHRKDLERFLRRLR